MPSLKQPNPLPNARELAKWRVERMVLVKRRRAIFRRHGITIIVVERDDGWWHIDRMKGGKVQASKIVRRLSSRHYELVTGRSLPPFLRDGEEQAA
jgi:hypothetical protein